MNAYMILEKVSGDFRVFDTEPLKFKQRMLEIRLDSRTLTVAYAVQSNGSPREIVEHRIAVNQLCQAIFGQGFGRWSAELFRIEGSNLYPVYVTTNTMSNMEPSSPRIFQDVTLCFELLAHILMAQIRFESYGRDALIAGVTQTEISGFINTSFSWSWWTLEWLLRGLEYKCWPKKPLSFDAISKDGTPKMVADILEPEFRAFLREFKQRLLEDYSVEESYRTRIEKELAWASAHRVRQFFNPSVSKLFRLYKDTLLRFLRMCSDPRLSAAERTTIEVWTRDGCEYVRQLVNSAQEARHAMFHEGVYGGLLAEPGRLDRWNEFRSLVRVLVCLALCREPSEYDIHATRCPLTDLPQDRLVLPYPPLESRGTISWEELAEGHVVVKLLPVHVEPTDWKPMQALTVIPEKSHLFSPSPSKSLLSFQPPLHAGHTLQLGPIHIKGHMSLPDLKMYPMEWEIPNERAP